MFLCGHTQVRFQLMFDKGLYERSISVCSIKLQVGFSLCRYTSWWACLVGLLVVHEDDSTLREVLLV